MPKKTRTDLPPESCVLYERGCTALDQGDYNSSIAIFNRILDAEPGSVTCRKLLRKAELIRAKRKTGFWGICEDKACEWHAVAQAGFYLYTKPLKAIQAAERALNHAPADILAHEILAHAALKVKMPRTALLSLEFILRRAPIPLGAALDLAEALAQTGKTSEAVSVCGRLLKKYSQNRRVNKVLSHIYPGGIQASAETDLSPGKADADANAKRGSKTYSAVPIKDVQAAISQYEILLSHGPNNLRVLKNLGNLYAKKSNFDRALEYYWRALNIVGDRRDPELEKAIADISGKREKAEKCCVNGN